MDDTPIQPGIGGPGSPQNFAELFERSLQRASNKKKPISQTKKYSYQVSEEQPFDSDDEKYDMNDRRQSDLFRISDSEAEDRELKEFRQIEETLAQGLGENTYHDNNEEIIDSKEPTPFDDDDAVVITNNPFLETQQQQQQQQKSSTARVLLFEEDDEEEEEQSYTTTTTTSTNNRNINHSYPAASSSVPVIDPDVDVPVFDDDEAWNEWDEEEEEEDKNKSKGVYQYKEEEEEDDDDDDDDDDNKEEDDKEDEEHPPPPTSSLVRQMFHSKNNIKTNNKTDNKNNRNVLSLEQQWKKKIMELDEQIQTYKQKQATWKKIKTNEQNDIRITKQELQSMRDTLAQREEEFSQYENETMKRIKKSKSDIQQQQRKLLHIPERRENQAMQELEETIQQLKNEANEDKDRMKRTIKRMKHRIDCLEDENSLLRQEKQSADVVRFGEWEKKEQKWKHEMTNTLKKEKIVIENRIKQRYENKLNDLEEEIILLRQELASKNKSNSTKKKKKSIKPSKENTENELFSTENHTTDYNNNHQKQHPFPVTPTRHVQKHSTQENYHTEENDDKKQQQHKHNNHNKNNININDDDDDETDFEEIRHIDNKIERRYKDGSRLIIFHNGSTKYLSPTNDYTRVNFPNGDRKEKFSDGRIVYYYSSTNTTHISYHNGDEVYHFGEQQTEKHFANGNREIYYADQTIKYIFNDGSTRTIFPDGAIEES